MRRRRFMIEDILPDPYTFAYNQQQGSSSQKVPIYTKYKYLDITLCRESTLYKITRLSPILITSMEYGSNQEHIRVSVNGASIYIRSSIGIEITGDIQKIANSIIDNGMYGSETDFMSYGQWCRFKYYTKLVAG